MTLRPEALLLAAVVAAALVTTCTAPPDPAGDGGVAAAQEASAAAAAPPASWKAAMQRIDADHETVQSLLRSDPIGDLETVAAAARRAARCVALGHGQFEDEKVADFAVMARACERWFDELALEAERGNGALCRVLLVKSEEHCTRCHDSSDEAYR